ncbi:gephyrin-like molybdotransferase Glp [Flavobacterium sp.]|uniref:molybdopterin molybdotransferase MoeA n=1 Tax=Flavobacterium sp. TaxID=239 RepID=UPI0011F4CE4E|nr:gephyrin-like molybdotransferase Glp [Flavobacterium sp.]RZJ73032.1 MAG: molybdopterin molybdenumtransferase MoeA [Flavobacterium sp.]
MISVSEAKKIILENTTFFHKRKLTLAEAFGCVLAEDVIAKTDIPNFDQSSMDGYAIRFSDSKDPMELVGEMAAGTSKQLSIKQAQATRIFTGAPLPNGADTILMQEKASVENGILSAQDENLKLGLHVRPKGSEVKSGEIAMVEGTLLSAAAIGFLAGIGETEVCVFAPPRIGIILTGNELQTPGNPLEFGQVYEANSLSLGSALRKSGVSDIDIYTAEDDPEKLQSVLQKALDWNDVVLLNGGVSVGDYDFVVEAAAKTGVKQHFHKVKQKPGKPLFFGSKNGKLVFGLPGNPSSALTCFYQYVLPALCRIMKKDNPVLTVKAELTHDYPKPVGLTHFVKAFFENGKVTPLHAQESYRMHSFAQANCFLVLPEDSSGISKGETSEVHLVPL